MNITGNKYVAEVGGRFGKLPYIFNMEQEIWKDVVGFEGYYEVSSYGRIYGVKTQRILKQKKVGNILTVYLSKNGKDNHYSVSQLVAQSFVENPQNYKKVKHIDGNIENNKAENLIWVQNVIYGIGIIDIENIDYNHDASYIAWKGMIWRCYSKKCSKRQWYKDCYVCKEWLIYSNFKKWFDEQSEYQDGYCLDKDILVKGNKVYSPDTCCFVPQIINVSILLISGNKYNLPNGVSFDKTRNRYIGHGTHCKRKYFNNPDEAYAYFKEKKEKYIKAIATKYYNEHKISKRVYESLLNFSID